MVKGIPWIIVLILFVELFERFCYYTIQGSQKSFMNQKLHYDSAQSTTISLVWGTLCYLTCLGGGVLGDRFLGRFLTIGILGTWYALGCFGLAMSTLPSVNSGDLFLVSAFAGVAVGTGGIKPLVCNFGAEQITLTGEEGDKAKESFFSYFYWMIQIGAGVALSIMTTIATSPTQFGISANMGYFTSYFVAALGMAAALVCFLGGSCGFRNKFLTSSSKIFRPVMMALVDSAKRCFRGKIALLGWILTIPFFGLVFWQAFAHRDLANDLAWAACAVALVQLPCLCWAHSSNDFLRESGSREALTGESLSPEDISLTFQTIPLLLIANTIFNFAYSMMLGPFYNQACQMDLSLGGRQINGSVFNIADTLAIIIFIPLFEAFLYPMWGRLQGREVGVNQKLLLGFVFALLAMVSAAALEIGRRQSAVLGPPGYLEDPNNATLAFPGMSFDGDSGPYAWSNFQSLMGACKVPGSDKDWCSNCAAKVPYPDYMDGRKPEGEAGIYMSAISGLWMFLPYGLIGMGEICVNPVLYYYAFSKTPTKTKSVIQAVNLIFQGAYPPALTGAFVTAFSSAMPNNLNKGMIGNMEVGLEVFYYIGAAFVLIGTPIFLVAKRVCVLVPIQGHEEEENLSASIVISHLGSFNSARNSSSHF
mmetsp:Transcript_16156/g.34942  ORF Transcript_16156/g.34942 Transcript_16156/m.34942 type:complete len:648 (+) Transcript_16156:170-2113(+)